jgi:hypothetical protein
MVIKKKSVTQTKNVTKMGMIKNGVYYTFFRFGGKLN